MSLMPIYAALSEQSHFWRLRNTVDKQTQTEICPFQSVGYAVLRRCKYPQLVWNYIDAVPKRLDCGVLIAIEPNNESWIPSFKLPKN